jgi:hypothetical protein
MRKSAAGRAAELSGVDAWSKIATIFFRLSRGNHRELHYRGTFGDCASKISFALFTFHRGGRVMIDDTALAFGETAAAQFSKNVFDGSRI